MTYKVIPYNNTFTILISKEMGIFFGWAKHCRWRLSPTLRVKSRALAEVDEELSLREISVY